MPQAEPPRSLIERAARWLIGTDRREAEAQAQAQAAQEQAAALAQAQAEAAAEAARDRLAVEARAEAQAQAARAAQVASVDAAATSTEPLIRAKTPTGGEFYFRRQDWLTARAAGERDVSLVDWRGDPMPPKPGKDTPPTLRVSTIEASVLRPLPIIHLDAYLPTNESEQTHARDEGYSASL